MFAPCGRCIRLDTNLVATFHWLGCRTPAVPFWEPFLVRLFPSRAIILKVGVDGATRRVEALPLHNLEIFCINLCYNVTPGNQLCCDMSQWWLIRHGKNLKDSYIRTCINKRNFHKCKNEHLHVLRCLPWLHLCRRQSVWYMAAV